MKFTNILYPVDFSERCRVVAPFVRAAVKRHRASLILANFVEIPALWYGTAEAPCAPNLNTEVLIEEAGQRLLSFAGEFFCGTAAKIFVEEGDPGSSIAAMVRELGIDLIMMPTRGLGTFRAALLGSVAAKVLHDVECPVWTAAHAETPEYSASPEWRRVVCAVDSTPGALRLIRCAREIASAYGAQVHLVHALPPHPATRMEQYLSRDFDAALEDSARQAIDALQREAGTDFRLCIEAGSVPSMVAEVAAKDEADLVLIGRGALPYFAGRLRTNVYSIIRDAPCPVLSI
jgi:nucleotide-binding universal stress UspA family protein